MPEPHEEYLHGMGVLHPYNKELKKALKGIKAKVDDGKLNIDDLIEKIIAKSGPAIGKHWKDTKSHHFQFTWEELRDILEEHEDEIKEEGGISDELAIALTGAYRDKASSYVQGSYQSRLQQIPIEKGRESLAYIARFTGNEHHIKRRIDRTVRHDSLAKKVGLYHDATRTKADELVGKKDVKEKKGLYDFSTYLSK